MTALSSFLTVLAVLAGLIVMAAAVVAYFRSNYAKATIDTLRDSNTALTSRVTELEAEVGRHKVRADGLEREAATLRTYVSGTEAVHELDAKITAYHTELREHRRTLLEHLRRLEELAAEVQRRRGEATA